jgi:hypothetical protein
MKKKWLSLDLLWTTFIVLMLAGFVCLALWKPNEQQGDRKIIQPPDDDTQIASLAAWNLKFSLTLKTAKVAMDHVGTNEFDEYWNSLGDQLNQLRALHRRGSSKPLLLEDGHCAKQFYVLIDSYNSLMILHERIIRDTISPYDAGLEQGGLAKRIDSLSK